MSLNVRPYSLKITQAKPRNCFKSVKQKVDDEKEEKEEEAKTKLGTGFEFIGIEESLKIYIMNMISTLINVDNIVNVHSFCVCADLYFMCRSLILKSWNIRQMFEPHFNSRFIAN